MSAAFWSTLPTYTPHQAAWLWDGQHEPPGEVPRYLTLKPHPVNERLPESGRIICEMLEALAAGRPRDDDTPLSFTREELRAFAEQQGTYRPPFLFPEPVPGAPGQPIPLPGRAVQPVYQIIAALWTMYYGAAPTTEELASLVAGFEADAETHKLTIPDPRTIAGHLKKAFGIV